MPTIPFDQSTQQFLSLAELTVARYGRCGRFVQGFVRGKLLHDPVYRSILGLNILPEKGCIVDLGCGRGILLTLLTTLSHLQDGKASPVKFLGVELRNRDAKIAQDVLEGEATILNTDISVVAIPTCHAVVLLDVLLYLPKSAQEVLLQRVAQSLLPDGILIMREADAGAGLRFNFTRWGEQFCALARGHWRQRYCYRPQQDWIRLLSSLGFNTQTYPMSKGTPFANVLFIARRMPEC